MNIEIQFLVGLIAGILAAAVAFAENKLSKKENNNRENLKVGIITFISVLSVLFFTTNQKQITQIIHTGTPKF